MHRLLTGLNEPQRTAVTTTRGPVLVLAGAGTGKTRVITHRMAWLINEGVVPRHVLALTFTNKAAREMKERFIGLMDGVRPREEFKQLFAGTFHSFCVQILRRYIDRLDYKKNFTIYDEGDQVSLLRKILGPNAGKGPDSDMNRIKFLIGLAKNRGYTPEEADGDALLARVFRRYQEELKLLNAVDFDDLLMLTVRLLNEWPEVRDMLREQYRYLMVDEYQDTNHLQFEIVRMLASVDKDVCVVGDDDQSIYSWRGAENSHILEFEKSFPGATVVKLEQNYRCTPRILRAANQVIRNNSRRHLKKLWSDAAEGEPIRLVTAGKDTEESVWVAGDILAARRDYNLKWEDFAILYRANHLSRVFEMELRRLRIPYRVVGGMGFYERREVKDVLAYLQVLANPHDDASLLRVINHPPRGVGKTTIEGLVRGSRERNISVWGAMTGHLFELPGRSQEGLNSFASLVGRFRPRFGKADNWSQAFKELLDSVGYYEELKRTSKDTTEYTSRAENVQEFVSALASYQEKAKGEAEITDFIDAMLLDNREDDKEKDGFGVSLMTLHAAKGLEFTRVYLVGVEEGILPHERVKLEGNLEEERRLFYVGITRARKTLTLSLCHTRRRYGQDEPRHPSSFLTELPQEDLEPLEAASAMTKLDHGSAMGQLSSLRARLAGGG